MFTLSGDIDHASGEEFKQINFGSIIRVTDRDGDTVAVPLCIKVENATDLVPTVSVVYTTNGVVNEAALGAAAGIEGSSESAALGVNGDPSEATSGTITYEAGDGPTKLFIEDKNGVQVDVTAGGTVTGQYGTLVVTIVGGVPNWTYTLTNTLDHDTPNQTGINDTVTDNFKVTVIDADGDSTAADGIQAAEIISITITDDGPSVTVSGGQQSLSLLNLDETTDISGLDTYGPGDPVLPGYPDNNGESDDTGVASPLGAVTTAVGVVGGLFNVVKVAGADGEQSDARALSLQLIAVGGLVVDQGGGLQTELAATQPAPGGNPVGGAIYLFKEADGTITGRVGNAEDGPIAFRVSLTGADPATAQLEVEQFLAIDHPNAPDAFDEQQFLAVLGDTSGGSAAGIALNLSVTVTDGDNDTHTDDHTVFITGKIGFDDDGPVAVGASTI